MTEEDRKFVTNKEGWLATVHGADRDTARLCRIIRSYEKILAEGVVVYGVIAGECSTWNEAKFPQDTHRARLVQIEEIGK